MIGHSSSYYDYKERCQPGLWLGENIFALASNKLPYWKRIKSIKEMTQEEIIEGLRNCGANI